MQQFREFKEEILLDEVSNRLFVGIILDDKDVYNMLSNIKERERMDIIKRSIKIGTIALRNAAITIDTNYVQKEVEKLISEIDIDLKTNLGKDGMKGDLERFFGENGYLENKLREKFKDHEKTIADIFKDENINSPLYKIKRYIEENTRQVDNNLYSRLDPGNKDSLLFRLKEDIIKKIDEAKNAGDVDIIARSIEGVKEMNRSDKESIKKEIQTFREDYVNKIIDMKKTFHDEISDVKNIVASTNVEIAKLAKEKQIVDITTLKGMIFEEVLFQQLSIIALTKYGDTIDVINLGGGEKSGDLVISIKDNPDKIIVRAESTSKENVQMADTIFKHLNNAMKERNTEFGIKVYENELPSSIGPILIGDNKIICSYLRGYVFEGYPLAVAYEIFRSMIIRKNLGINGRDVKLNIDNIVRLMNTLQHITGNLTKMENLCTNTKNQLEELRDNINNELNIILTKSIDNKEIRQLTNGEEDKGNQLLKIEEYNGNKVRKSRKGKKGKEKKEE